jgi:hypothetical protein
MARNLYYLAHRKHPRGKKRYASVNKSGSLPLRYMLRISHLPPYIILEGGREVG